MRRRFKQIIAAVAAAGMLLGGCKSESQENTAESNAQGQAGQEESVKLVFWDMMWGEAGIYDVAAEKLVQQFMDENPGITVDYQSIPWDNYYQTFLTAITSGSGPDVATAGSQTPMQFAAMGEILPLTPLVEKWEEKNDPILEDMDSMAEGIVETNNLDGEYVALPWQIDTRVFTYRTDMFQEAGIEQLPETWDELLDALRMLKEKFPDIFPFVTAGDLAGAQNLMMWLTVSDNASPITEDYQSAFTSEEMKECLEFVAALSDEGLIPEATVSYKDADAQKLFYTGSAAIYYGAPVVGFFEDENLKDKVDILNPISGPSADKAQTVYWANSIAAYNQDEEKTEAIYTFIEWWIKNSKILFTEGKCGKVPVLTEITEDAYYDTAVLENLVNTKISSSFVHATAPIKNFYEAFGQINGERYLGNAAQKVLSGRRDYDAILEEDNGNVIDALELQSE